MSQYNISPWVYELFDKVPGTFLEIGGSNPGGHHKIYTHNTFNYEKN